jgi:hypothetical protein
MGENFAAEKGDVSVVQVCWMVVVGFGIYLVNFVNYYTVNRKQRMQSVSQQLYVASHNKL